MKMEATHSCPQCGKKLGAHTAADGSNAAMKEGDASVCLYCGMVAFFEGGKFRQASKGEELQMRIDHENEMRVVDAVRAQWEKRRMASPHSTAG